jgi:hypothetical protein
MMIIVVLALLVLTAAVGLLFAMMGELTSRLPAADGRSADTVTPLDDYHPGATADDWPAGLLELSTRSRSALLVLSPVCSTCDGVAAELSSSPPGAVGTPLGLVVSCGDRERGEEFVVKHSLQAVPHLIDEGGAWATGNFGVNMSPSALLFENGVLTEGYRFGTFHALQDKLGTMALEGST